MEIRNNTPSFGMAFRAPAKEQMGIFTKYLTDDFRVPSRLTKRGLAKIVDKHAKDTHFDIHYESETGVTAFSKTDKSRSMYRDGLLDKQNAKKGVLERYKEKYISDSYKEVYRGASPTKRFLMNLGRILDSIKTSVVMEFRPEEVLPRDLRTASENVERWEKLVKAECTKDAAAEAKRIKKAEKRSQTIARAIDDVSSVFEPKEIVKTSKTKHSD